MTQIEAKSTSLSRGQLKWRLYALQTQIGSSLVVGSPQYVLTEETEAKQHKRLLQFDTQEREQKKKTFLLAVDSAVRM